MTPEEILAECPELKLRFNMLGLVNFSHHVKTKGDIEIISNEVATAWAQSRKEARELREALDSISRKGSELRKTFSRPSGCDVNSQERNYQLYKQATEFKLIADNALKEHRSTQHG